MSTTWGGGLKDILAKYAKEIHWDLIAHMGVKYTADDNRLLHSLRIPDSYDAKICISACNSANKPSFQNLTKGLYRP